MEESAEGRRPSRWWYNDGNKGCHIGQQEAHQDANSHVTCDHVHECRGTGSRCATGVARAHALPDAKYPDENRVRESGEDHNEAVDCQIR